LKNYETNVIITSNAMQQTYRKQQTGRISFKIRS